MANISVRTIRLTHLPALAFAAAPVEPCVVCLMHTYFDRNA